MLILSHIFSISAMAAAAVYAGYVVLWRKRQDALLVPALLAAALVEGLDAAALHHPESFLSWRRPAMVCEALMVPAFMAYSLFYARERNGRGLELVRSLGLLDGLLLLGALLLAPMALAMPAELAFRDDGQSGLLRLGLTRGAYVFYTGVLAGVLLSLVNLEQTLTSASHAVRWKIKLVLLGVGTILAGQLIYYSQVFLTGRLDLSLTPVRSLAMAAAVPLILYSRLARDEAARIVVSRKVAYGSVVLLAFGLYLVCFGMLAAARQRFPEADWLPAALAVALVAGAGLLAALMSESLKRRVKGFIERNFYEDKYDYRAHWMEFTERLSGPRTGKAMARTVLEAFCETFGLREAALYLAEAGPGEAGCATFRHQADMEQPNLPRGLTLTPDRLAELQARGMVSMVDAAPQDDPELARLRESFHMRLVLPLTLGGKLEGLVLLGRAIGPEDGAARYTLVDFDLMTAMARQAAAALGSLAMAEQLSAAREMEMLGRVSTFVAHDIKNQVYTLSLMLDNARNFITDPEFQQDMLETLGSTVAKMKVLIAQLRAMPDAPSLRLEPADLLEVVREALPLAGAASVRLTGNGARAMVDREEVRKVALNLILNALDATGGGPVEVEVGQDTSPFLRVADAGCGMDEQFVRSELFKPFRTTKRKGMGIGLYQCKHIVEAHGGRIEVQSRLGLGSVFTVRLPGAAGAADEAGAA